MSGDWTIEERLAQDGAIDPLLFYRPTDENGEFSNFSRHSIVLPNPWTGELVEYPRGEYRFQAMKAITPTVHDQIVACKTPADAKSMGRRIKLRPDWGNDVNSMCWYVMLELVLAKTLQHREVWDCLEESGDRTIYEDSPRDLIWGWRFLDSYAGKNLLGRCWMQARTMLGVLWE